MRIGRALKEKNFDLRLRDKLLAEGKVTPEQIKEYMASLQDEEGNLITLGPAKKEYTEQPAE